MLVQRTKSFWANVDKNGLVPEYAPELGNCWLWTGHVQTNGYGGSAGRLAHRMAYGEIPDGLQVDHLCRVHNCVRRSHLEAVTSQENQRRGEPARRTHCPNGHEYTAANTYLNPRKPTGYSRRCRKCIVVHTLKQNRVRRLRSLRRDERGHITGGVMLVMSWVVALALALTFMTLYLAEDADDTIRGRIEALEQRTPAP